MFILGVGLEALPLYCTSYSAHMYKIFVYDFTYFCVYDSAYVCIKKEGV